MWDEITCPFPNVNSEAIEVWEWISNFIPNFTGCVIIYPCHDLSQSMLVEGALGSYKKKKTRDSLYLVVTALVTAMMTTSPALPGAIARPEIIYKWKICFLKISNGSINLSGLETFSCILGHHWFRWWFVVCSAPSRYLNQCYLMVA